MACLACHVWETLWWHPRSGAAGPAAWLAAWPASPTWASGVWAAASWPCTVCHPAVGSEGSPASGGSHSNGTLSCPWKQISTR